MALHIACPYRNTCFYNYPSYMLVFFEFYGLGFAEQYNL